MAKRSNSADNPLSRCERTFLITDRGFLEPAHYPFPFISTMSAANVPTFPTPTPQTPGAIDPNDRILTIDILRGIALFGVLMVNLLTEFRVSIFNQFVPSEATGSSFDRLLDAFVSYALDMKAFSLFSLLFGVGLAIQFDRLANRGRPLYWLRRRLVILLGFGLCHLVLIWNGDILTEYALAGLFVLGALRHDEDTLVLYALLAFWFYLVMPIWYGPLYWPRTSTFALDIAQANRIYPHGSLLQILQFSVHELKLMIPLHVGVFPRTIALMLVGAWLWKSEFLRDLRAHRARLLAFGLLAIATGVAVTAAESGNLFSEHKVFADVLSRLGAPIQALGYAALIAVAVDRPYIGQLLKVFAPLGRMAFTNYIVQSLIFCWIFLGYGLGQFDQMSMTTAFLLGSAVYAAQILCSILWLRRFRFGPLEWLWRSLMYGQRQSMRNQRQLFVEIRP
jgi:uncharacterized protein